MKSNYEIVVLSKRTTSFLLLFFIALFSSWAQDGTDNYNYDKSPVFVIDGKKYNHDEISQLIKDRQNLANNGIPFTIPEFKEKSPDLNTLSEEYKTKNVFVFVIDGIRNTEGMEAKTDFLFYIWNNLRPLGTMYTNFYNKGITLTTSGHYTLLTGTQEALINNSNTPHQSLRPYFPTLFEYNRKFNGSSESKNLFISGKNTIVKYPVGLFPSFGVAYKPNIVLTSHHDYDTYDTAVKLIFKDHPSLTYVIFAQVDAYGHTYDQDDYFASIYQVDYLINDLFFKIMNDPYYKDNTTIIITADHGRHDEAHGSWKEHGDNCHGCRHIPFLAIGPDFKKNWVVTTDYDVTDLAPTIAHLLHVPAPFSYGKIMTELFNNYIPVDESKFPPLIFGEENISKSKTHSIEPSIDLAKGNINVAYVDESAGINSIYYSKSDLGAFKWTSPQPIISDIKSVFSNPVIKIVSDTMLLIAANGLLSNPIDSTFDWITYSAYSKDSGNTWSAPAEIEIPATFTTKPAISVNYNRVNIISQQLTRILSNASNDQGMTFDKGSIVFDSSEYKNLNFPQNPSAVHVDNRCFAMWHTLMPSRKNGTLCYAIEPWDNRGAILYLSDTNEFSFYPKVAVDDLNTIHVVYSKYDEINNWKLYYQNSGNYGASWSSPILLSENQIAMSPQIQISDNGKIIVCYTVYNSLFDLWTIKVVGSSNSGNNWSYPNTLTSSQQYILSPDFEVTGDDIYLTWQDFRNGKSEIYFKKVKFDGNIGVEDNKEEPKLSVWPSFFSNHLCFNFTLTEESDLNIELFNSTGAQVFKSGQYKYTSGEHVLEIDLPQLSAGIYTYRVISNQNQMVGKLIKAE